jgi:IS5 family transposase
MGSTTKMKSLFGEEDRLARISSMGDPLERVAAEIDFEMFRPTLKRVLDYGARPQGGRPPYDAVLMLKVLMLEQWYGVADDKMEFLICDRLSFQRFLGLTLDDRVPDAKTIWLFRERLKETGAHDALFEMFVEAMQEKGIITRKGSIVDATFVDAPRQRNSREDNAAIKDGRVPDGFKENPHVLAQKDTDARWAKKNNETHYGYKDHVKADRDSKMIVSHALTDASVYDSKEIAGLIDGLDERLWADSAYVGEELHKDIKKKSANIRLYINEKGYKGRPLDDGQKAANKAKSKVRVRVEHIFGHMTKAMGGITVRCIGIGRARCCMAMKDLAYNLSRYVTIRKAKGQAT